MRQWPKAAGWIKRKGLGTAPMKSNSLTVTRVRERKLRLISAASWESVNLETGRRWDTENRTTTGVAAKRIIHRGTGNQKKTNGAQSRISTPTSNTGSKVFQWGRRRCNTEPLNQWRKTVSSHSRVLSIRKVQAIGPRPKTYLGMAHHTTTPSILKNLRWTDSTWRRRPLVAQPEQIQFPPFLLPANLSLIKNQPKLWVMAS